MEATEIRQYQQQLEQVQGALKGDPHNAELRTLEGELKNLIDLTTQLISTQADTGATSSRAVHDVVSGPNETSAPTSDHRYVVGDECQAKYEADGRWYPARIVAVAGSSQIPMYTILFKGYSDTEVVTAASIRATKDTASVLRANGQTPSATSKKLTAAEEAERDRKKRRSEKKAERSANRTAEANAVQSSWQKFAKKAEKKGVMKKDKSIFKTPEDPLAKVGVVGAGRGMTQYEDRKKHTYEDER